MKKKFRKIWIGLLSGMVALNFFGLQACVYGPPERWSEEDVKQTRQHLDSIRGILQERQHVDVNNSTINMEEYQRETQRLEKEAASLEKRLKDMEKNKSN